MYGAQERERYEAHLQIGEAQGEDVQREGGHHVQAEAREAVQVGAVDFVEVRLQFAELVRLAHMEFDVNLKKKK